MRSRVLWVAVVAGFIGCGESDLLSNVANTLGGGGPSSVTIVVGDSNAVPGFRPNFDTVATIDTVEWSVLSEDLDAPYNITWDGAPPGAQLPPNSGDLMGGAIYDAPALTTPGYYTYHCTHHKGMSGTLYVLMAVNNAKQRDQTRRP